MFAGDVVCGQRVGGSDGHFHSKNPVRLVNPRSTVPLQVFHIASHVITDGTNLFVVHLAMDEATRFVFFRASPNHQTVVSNNINQRRSDVDVIAKEMAFLALIQDICYRRVPTLLIHDSCEMLRRQNIKVSLTELGIRHNIASVAQRDFNNYFKAIFRCIKKRRQQFPNESVHSSVKVVQDGYNRSTQSLIWATPNNLFHSHYNIRADMLMDVPNGPQQRLETSEIGSFPRVHSSLLPIDQVVDMVVNRPPIAVPNIQQAIKDRQQIGRTQQQLRQQRDHYLRLRYGSL